MARWSLLTLIVLALAACSETGATAAQPLAPLEATPPSTLSTSTTVKRSLTSTQSETESLPAVLGLGPLFLRPVDPASLMDLPGATRFGVGAALWSAVSPSGQWLAAAGFSTTEGDDPTLRLVDVATWTSSELLAVPQLGRVVSLAVSDSGTITWLRSEVTGWRVYQLPRGKTQPVLVAEMQPTLLPIVDPDEIGALTDEYLAVPAHEFDGDHYGGGIFIVIVDLTTGALTTVPLEGVWSGHVSEEQGDGADIGRSLEPGFGFDRGRDLLYVVSASADELFVVDLKASEIVEQRDFQEPSSLLSRVFEWWVPKAEAKFGEAARRNLAVSPEGSHLYVATARAESKTIDGKFRWQDVPLGIEVIDTETLSVIAQSELPVSDVAISPDGSVLMAVGVHEKLDDDGYSVQGSGVYLLDARNLSVVSHLDDGVGYDIGGFSPDSGYAYMWSFSSDVLNHVAIDVSNGTFLASRNVQWPGYLISPVAVVADKSQ